MRRRNATTEFLKECIADALLRLMKTKSLDEITVQELTDLADVGRVTYYRNFTSKEDVLGFKLELLCQECTQEIARLQLQDKSALAGYFFTFLLSIREVVLTLYQGGQIQVLLHTFYKLLGPQPGGEERDTYQRAFVACGLFGFVHEWIKGGFRETPEQLSDMLLHWGVDL